MSSKAGLSELFAAAHGVIAAGVVLSKQGIKIEKHPLLGIAADGATILWNAQYKAATRPISASKTQEHIARPLVKFLEMALPILGDYPKVGQAALVSDHVRDILVREIAEDPRPLERFKEGGTPSKKFKIDYGHDGAKGTKREGSADEPEMKKDSSSKRAKTVSESFSYRLRVPQTPAAFA